MRTAITCTTCYPQLNTINSNKQPQQTDTTTNHKQQQQTTTNTHTYTTTNNNNKTNTYHQKYERGTATSPDFPLSKAREVEVMGCVACTITQPFYGGHVNV